VKAISFSLTRCSKEGNATEGDSSTEKTLKFAPRPVISVETSIEYMNSDGKKLLSFKHNCLTNTSIVRFITYDYHVIVIVPKSSLQADLWR